MVGLRSSAILCGAQCDDFEGGEFCILVRCQQVAFREPGNTHREDGCQLRSILGTEAFVQNTHVLTPAKPVVDSSSGLVSAILDDVPLILKGGSDMEVEGSYIFSGRTAARVKKMIGEIN
jgi:hypothetical protein